MRKRSESRASPGYYIGAVLCTVGALLGKEMGITVPAALLLTDLLFFTPKGKGLYISYWRSRIPVYAPFFLIAVLYSALRVYLVLANVVTNTYSGPSRLSLGELIDATASNILLALGVWSAPLHVANLTAASKVALIMVILLAAVVVVRALGRPALYALLWAAVTLLPTANLSATRWMYIPSFGLCLLVGLLAARLAPAGARSNALAGRGYLLGWLLVLCWGLGVVVENVTWHRSGEVARSTLAQIGALAPNPPGPAIIYFSGAPSNYGSALLFNTGLPSAMSLVYPAGGVELHEVEQRLADPLIEDALKTPPVLKPNAIFMGFREGKVSRYGSFEELLKATGKR